jgi:hypothetical protein
MTLLPEPQELNGRTILAVVALADDPSDQRGVIGVGRWSGSVLSLECSAPSISLPMNVRWTIPVTAFAIDRLCMTPEELESIRSVLVGVDYVTYILAAAMPAGARPIPEGMYGAFSWVPSWRGR